MAPKRPAVVSRPMVIARPAKPPGADGEVWQECSICFGARIVGSQLAVADEESTEVRFVNPGDVDQLPTGRSTRLRMQHFIERRNPPYSA